jgi:2-C-methyl-D-erythritol 4-phosphate cytidylyltransferase
MHKGSIVTGGKERQDSVYNGLQSLADDTDIVLVHDGVRPLVTHKIIRESLRVAERDGACIAAVPVKDTIKRVQNNVVQKTLNRAELWQVQTPQTARYQWLMAAHSAARQQNYYTTDEAALLEWHGYPVSVINGDYNNIKITTPEDLAIARVIYQEV